jgi:hypothetical protein
MKTNKILTLVFSGLFLSCEEDRKSGEPINGQSSNLGVLDRTVFTKNFMDSKITKGMHKDEVESLIGVPYGYENFMGTLRANYRLSEAGSKGLSLSAFTIVYKNGEVKSILEEWEGTRSGVAKP